MTGFGAQGIRPMESLGDSTHAFSKVGAWNVDLTNANDSRVANSRNSTMPAEFGDVFEIFEGPKLQAQVNQIEKNMQLELQLMILMTEQFMQYMNAILRAEMAGMQPGSGSSSSGADAQQRGISSGGDQCHHPHESKPPVANDSKPVDHGGNKPVDNGGNKPVDNGGNKPVDNGGSKPVDNGGIKPVDTGGRKPVDNDGSKRGDNGGSKPVDNGGSKPVDDGSSKPGDNGGSKPVDDGGSKPVDKGGSNPGDNGGKSKGADGVPKYENIPAVERGQTIYRNDFNGPKGTHPDPKVFDTAHIGPDNKERQSGPSIDEQAVASPNNTLEDGKGNLQLFPIKQTIEDPDDKKHPGDPKHYLPYTKGTFNTAQGAGQDETGGLKINLKDYPDGVVIETRAKHPTASGAKFDALWIMTHDWAADPKKGQKSGDTVEFDAAEGDAGITTHFPSKDANGNTTDKNYGKAMNFDDGKFHTYTVVIKPNAKSGRGDVTEYVDGKEQYQRDNVFPGDQDLNLKASLEISPKWTHQTYTGDGGMNSTGAGLIDYLDVSALKPSK